MGFDVEVEQPGIEQTVRLLCGPEEARALTPESALARWVATEAALKAFGASVREAPLVEFRAGQAFFRGEPLHGTPVDAFEGAAACVMTSRPVCAIELHSVPLADLF